MLLQHVPMHNKNQNCIKNKKQKKNNYQTLKPFTVIDNNKLIS